MPDDAHWDEARRTLEDHGLEPTVNRLLVLAALQGGGHPLSAREVHERVMAEHRLNRVTVYRILDLFAQHDVAGKISAGERGFRYCADPDRRPGGHVHFHCTSCGRVQCINSLSSGLDAARLARDVARSLPLDVHNIELRLDGICDRCKRSGG